MSSLNDYIRFALDIEAHNIVFKDYFYKILNGTKYKIYEAELIQPACPFCGSVSLIHNGHLIRLFKQRIKCRDCSKRSMAQSSLINTAVSLTLQS